MRRIHLFALLACLGRAAFAQAPLLPQLRYDHVDPVTLNEFAVRMIREGDTSTGWILLERAARLAPHDQRILHNLREVRAFRAGEPAPAVHPVAPAAQHALPVGDAGDMVPPEPPALWQAK